MKPHSSIVLAKSMVGTLYGQTFIVLGMLGFAGLLSDRGAQRKWLTAVIIEKFMSMSVIGFYYRVGGPSYIVTNAVLGIVFLVCLLNDH